MASVRKILAQYAPNATTLTDIYTVPADTQTVVSSLAIANRDSSDTTFRISVAVAAAANTNKQYVAYDAPIQGNDTVVMTIGITMSVGDVLRVYAGNANLSFNAFGTEIDVAEE